MLASVYLASSLPLDRAGRQQYLVDFPNNVASFHLAVRDKKTW